MRVFVTKWFKRWARREKLAEDQLLGSVEEVEDGLIDADLGGGLIKKRIARRGQGKSGGYRTILAYRDGEKLFFLYGFPKSARDNINAKELEALKLTGGKLLDSSSSDLELLIEKDELDELEYEQEEGVEDV